MDDLQILRRIAAIVPLMFSSDEKEVLHAARAIRRLLDEAGITSSDLAARLTAPPPPPPSAKVVPFPRAMPPEHVPPQRIKRGNMYTSDPEEARELDRIMGHAPQRRVKSAWAIDRDDILSVFIRRGELDAWSHEFLESIHEQVQGGRTLSEKQRDKLNEILDKLGA